MADLNKVFLIGRLTQDPELRYTPNGAAVTDLRLATSRSWTGKDGERKEDKLFIDVTVWNRQAENCCQYLKKGRQIHVEGYLRSESWESPSGEKRSKIKVEAERVQFLDRREDAGGDAPSHDEEFAPPAREARRGPASPEGRAPNGPGRSYGAPSPPPSRRPAEVDAEDEDIPF
jgi:single-strand DNA-binding protein